MLLHSHVMLKCTNLQTCPVSTCQIYELARQSRLQNFPKVGITSGVQVTALYSMITSLFLSVNIRTVYTWAAWIKTSQIFKATMARQLDAIMISALSSLNKLTWKLSSATHTACSNIIAAAL
ncbi:uncharacterized protein LOC110066279 isoform X2 [Orbicella faveolata]|uniref:uncharacterized protein LOC110066279 isoform X2 n=1 Tax=Orbicella faveolata TaxID=48498 RepID=UPI0009E46926|nr:uncharacterized protein LOC110066279 isoform X2 [Orbicella faveolata]